MLCQEGKVISYASRILKDPETLYLQTEREMLAVVWGVEHFHLYVYGSKFKIVTDHKQLLAIFNSQKLMSARIEKWRLSLMPYDCQLVYRPGHDNPADYLSRHPLPDNDNAVVNSVEEYVNYICRNAVPKAMTLTQVQEAS